MVEPETRPRPQVGRGDQTAFDGIAMHVVEFLQAFSLAEDSKGIEAALPEAEGGLVVNGRGKPQPGKGSRAPRMVGVGPKGPQKARGGSLLELLDEAAGGFGGLRPNQEMEMLGHQNPTEKAEVEFCPDLLQHLHKFTTESWTGE